MAATEFEATVRHRDGQAVIDLSGDIDRGAEAQLSAAYDDAVAGANGDGSLLLDFSRVAYINSTGIALIVGLLARARQERWQVTACGLSAHYREIFEITRLSDFMAIVPGDEAPIETRR